MKEIYLIREYDSFCDTSRIICAFMDKESANEESDRLNHCVEDANDQIAKCYSCPLYRMQYDNSKDVDAIECHRKSPHRMDDGCFCCDTYDKIEYEIYYSYGVKTVELR